MKNLFRSYTYTWWQMRIFKISLLSIGLIAGAYLSSSVQGVVWLVVAIAALATGYVIMASLTGPNKK